MKALICFVSACLLIVSSLYANPSNAFEPIHTVDGIEAYRLKSNGLTVLLLPNEVLPVAAVMVTYNVGGRNEVAGTTGATHILEHMMFKGTQTRSEANGYSQIMEQIGARSNATTYYDRTNYYAVLPREHVPLAIELEADRMRNLRIEADDLQSEMTVVRNEYERGENNPVRTLIKEMYAAAFMAHPYGHPVIGWRSDIETTSTEKLRAFYDTYYWPENATLTVIGGFDTLATLEAIEHYYGGIPRAPQPIPSVETQEPEQLGPRRLIIERAGEVGVVAIGYKVPEGIHKDWAALRLIEEILGAEQSGRLYRALDDKGKARASFTFAPQLRDPSLFFIGADLTAEITHQDAEDSLLATIATLAETGTTEAELARAKSVLRAQMVYGRDGPYAIASEINEYIAMGDWESYLTLPKAIETVTVETIQRVAARYFVSKNSTTAWYVPSTSQADSLENRSLPQANYFRDPELFQNHSTGKQAALKGAEKAKAEPFLKPDSTDIVDFTAQLQTTHIGPIEVVTIDMPIDGVVSFVGSFAAGETLSPSTNPSLATLCAAMLDQGTQTKDRFTIAEWLDNLGASMQFRADAHALNFSGRFLREDAGAVIALLAEQLREPAFDPDALDAFQSRQQANLMQARHNPSYLAGSHLSRTLYPKTHPNYTETIDDLLAALDTTSIADIRAFHAQHYGPHSMRLVFAGDIDFQQLTAAVESAFGDWRGGVDYIAQYPLPRPTEHTETRLEVADKTSVSAQLAQYTGLRRTHTDYLPFSIGNYILGGSFHSRLMTEVRKKRGLTYHIGTRHSGDILTPGHWMLDASFAPSMLEQGIEATDAVIRQWHTYGVTSQEVEAATTTLTGSYLVRLSTTAAVAQQVHSFLQRGLPAATIDHYPQRLRAITAEQVNAAIRDYFDPNNYALVAAGSLNRGSNAKPNPLNQTIRVQVDAPDAGWRIIIERVYRKADQLIVVSKLVRSDAPAAQVISAVSDSVAIPTNGETLAVQHYILGKTWDWGHAADYTFIHSVDELDGKLSTLELLYSAESPTSALPQS
ncbi:MAG: M16 family metallopeptidase [Opitutales bacterium]